MGTRTGMVTRTQAIKNFLTMECAANCPDLAQHYSEEMEVQVLVAEDDGEAIHKEYKGRVARVFTNGLEEWKSFRIPYNAGSDPEFTDAPMSFDLAAHVEAIGMTGWNWKQRKSVFVAFDFDAVVNHKQGLHDQELDEVQKAAENVPWVEVRKSTSGKGLHLYVYLQENTTQNHHEHAAVARAILSQLAAATGFDFKSRVDVCGGNMWVWARKMRGTDGLTIIKAATELAPIPPSWQSHMTVVRKRTTRAELPGLGDDGQKVLTDRVHTPLDEEHMRVIRALEGTDTWWNGDYHVLITHTTALARVHEDLGIRGIYRTISPENLFDHNCFCIPLPAGAWLVRRYTKYVTEDPTWFVDSNGWTSCYYNREPDLATLARSKEAVEREKGGFIFSNAEEAGQALLDVGANIDIHPRFGGRKATVHEGKDGRVVFKVAREEHEDPTLWKGWEPTKDKMWTRLLTAPGLKQAEPENDNLDHLVRHVITSQGSDYGWSLNIGGKWLEEPLAHVRLHLASLGYNLMETNGILGSSIGKCWTLVSRPFEPEYPGSREWNKGSPQFTVPPTTDGPKTYPTWASVLHNCGKSLDAATLSSPWCKRHGILTGADYLKCWAASLFQYPRRPLPYLFFYGPQNTGKSTFHEALSLLFHPGYMRADTALTNPSAFNAELINAVLCVVEETDLRNNKTAYNRIKDWVTSPMIPIHEKRATPTMIENTTHWVQCSNDKDSFPVLPGDTRVVFIYVDPPEHLIPRPQFFALLKAEAADFLGELLALEIPPSDDRLGVPPLLTFDKTQIMQQRMTPLELFLSEECHEVPGSLITCKDFYARFQGSLDPTTAVQWHSNRVGREMPVNKFPRGRQRGTGQWCYGNLSFEPSRPIGPPWVRSATTDYLEQL